MNNFKEIWTVFLQLLRSTLLCHTQYSNSNVLPVKGPRGSNLLGPRPLLPGNPFSVAGGVLHASGGNLSMFSSSSLSGAGAVLFALFFFFFFFFFFPSTISGVTTSPLLNGWISSVLPTNGLLFGWTKWGLLSDSSPSWNRTRFSSSFCVCIIKAHVQFSMLSGLIIYKWLPLIDSYWLVFLMIVCNTKTWLNKEIYFWDFT